MTLATMAASVKDIDNGWDALKKTLGKLGDLEVVVGIPGEIDFSVPTQAAIGAVHEFGSEDGVTPERSFLRSTFDYNESKYLKILERDVIPAGIKKGRADEAALLQLGETARADVIDRIVSQNLDNLPLADSTLAAKFPKSKALIEDGELVASIKAEVRPST